MNIYKAYPGKGARNGILFMIAITLVMLLPVIIIPKEPTRSAVLIPIGLITIALLGTFSYFSYVAATLRYILTEDSLIIKWGFSQKIIRLQDISNVEKRIGLSAFKTAGISWPGLHIGGFSMPGHQNLNLYATRLMGDVIIFKNKWEVIGITPEEPDLFLEELARLAPGLESKVIDHKEEEAAKKHAIQQNARVYKILTAVNLALLGLTFLWITLIIPSLPEKIPMHYGPNGVDRYGSPRELFVLPAISLATFVLMFIISRFYRGNKMAVYMLMGAAVFMTLIMNLVIFSMIAMS